VTVSYHAVGSIVFADIDGCVSVEEVRADLLDVITDQVHLGGVSALIDFRAVTSLLSPTDLRSLAADVRKLTRAQGKQRCAILVESDALFGLMRMLEAYSDGASVEVRAFRDRADAVDWLNAPEEAKP
jgi:SpoIIAA-like